MVADASEASETARGSRSVGYSAHEEAYPWANANGPLYQRQGLGTRNPAGRISVRTMRVAHARSGSEIRMEDAQTQTPKLDGTGLSPWSLVCSENHRITIKGMIKSYECAHHMIRMKQAR